MCPGCFTSTGRARSTDGFGYKRSHGCVNMSIGDARWIYEWADLGTWVYVTDPSGQTPSDAATYANDAGGP